jgi:hypothetical protein
MIFSPFFGFPLVDNEATRWSVSVPRRENGNPLLKIKQPEGLLRHTTRTNLGHLPCLGLFFSSNEENLLCWLLFRHHFSLETNGRANTTLEIYISIV